MITAATLRRQIEQELENRFPAALTPSPSSVREVASTGIPAADELLEGGLPVGAITEVTGAASSGRTTFALSFLACRMSEGRYCAWVDVQDALDPESAAANGVRLDHLLWVRCNDNLPRATGKKDGKPWTRLDQALRATDLLLQAGGFAAIVLDLADVAPAHGHRIPLATWFRYRQAADRTRCSLVVLGKVPYAQSSAALALGCSLQRPLTAGGAILRGFQFDLERYRQRQAPAWAARRKPPVSTWSAGTAWEAEKRA